VNRTIQETVFGIIGKVTGNDSAALAPHSNLFRDLGIDSAAALEIVVNLEDAFAVQIGGEDAAELETLADVVALIERLRP
jgi:acyl carrier protein